MTKAIVIFSGENFGGVERRFARLSASLISQGSDIILMLTADAKKTIDQMELNVPDERVIIIDTPSSGDPLRRKLNRIRGLLRMISTIRSLQISQVHFAMNPGLISYLYSCLRRFVPPYSISMVDSTFEYRARRLEKYFFRRSIMNAYKVDCLSPRLQEVILNNVDLKKPEKLYVAPCSFNDYSMVTTARERDIDVAMISRWVPGKGLELLEAAAESLPALNIHICGFGPMQPSIPSASLYETKESFQVLARTKIFLSLQQYNNYPSQSLLEAMASGCAIIATDVGETRLLLDKDCAILIPYKANALSIAIKSLIEDSSLRVQLGEAARKKVLQSHTIEAFSKYFSQYIL